MLSVGRSVIDPVNDLSTPKPGTPSSLPTATGTCSPTRSSVLYSDVDTDHTQHERLPLDSLAVKVERRGSEPVVHGKQELTVPQPLKRSLNENAISDMDKDTTIKDRIREWLLTILETNAIEKTVYQNTLRQTLHDHGFDYDAEESWMIPAVLYWGRDSRSGTVTEIQADISDSSNAVISTFEADPAAKPLLQRRPSKTAHAPNIVGSRALYLHSNRDVEYQLNDPTDFLLPPSPIVPPSQIGSDLEAEEDDPSHFPLPISQIGSDSLYEESDASQLALPPSPDCQVNDCDRKNNSAEVDDWFCVGLPPPPLLPNTEPSLMIHAEDLPSTIRSATQTPILTVPKISVEIPQDDDFLLTRESVSEPIPRLSHHFFG